MVICVCLIWVQNTIAMAQILLVLILQMENLQKHKKISTKQFYPPKKQFFSKLKAGVSWVDMHLTAERASLTVLKERGYLQGDIDEMVKLRIGSIFQPHGLGHFLGIDTHDVGGYGEHFPERLTDAGLKKTSYCSCFTSWYVHYR